MTYWPEKPRILTSFAYAESLSKEQLSGIGADLVIDSGAFTAYNNGTPISLEKYTRWLLSRQEVYSFAFALDVIGDHAASYRNWRQQRDSLPPSVKLVPSWHLGSPWEELERLCRETDYVAVGGVVPYAGRNQVLMRHLVRAHKIARDHNAALHGLGIASNVLVHKLPWASVDASSWQWARRYPMLLLADRSGMIRSIKRGKPLESPTVRLVKAYGLSPLTVSAPSSTNLKKRGREVANRTIDQYTHAGARGYTFVECAVRQYRPNFKVYLAAIPGDIPSAVAGHRLGSPFSLPASKLVSA